MARRSKNFIQSAIKRSGALSGRAKRSGRSTSAQAAHDRKHGTTLQKRQASFYQNVLAPANKKRKGSKKKSSSTHRVRAHHRTLSNGRKIRVRSHKRRRK